MMRATGLRTTGAAVLALPLVAAASVAAWGVLLAALPVAAALTGVHLLSRRLGGAS